MEIPNLKYEQKLWTAGVDFIAGVDEVGRGPLAGPFVVCAAILDKHRINDVILKNDFQNSVYSKINDSKALTDKKRRDIAAILQNELVSYSIIEISNEELDTIGISKATQKAFFAAIKNLKIKAQHIFTDLFEIKNLTKADQTNIKGGDRISMSVSAASIMAKVYRDDIMRNMAIKYPNYGFEKNMGYGTAQHIEAIKKHGICEIHRLSYEPVKSMRLP